MQTAYIDQAANPAVIGQVAEPDFHSIVSEGSAEVVDFGKGLTDVASGLVALPASAADIFAGIAIQKHRITRNNTETAFYNIGDAISVFKRGTIWVDAKQAVNPSLGVFMRFAGKKQVQTLVFDVDLITANTINGSVGGIAISPVVFTTSHLNTMNLLAAEILAKNANITTAVVGGTGNRTLTLTTVQDAADQALTGFIVTGGASQAVITPSQTQAAINSTRRGEFRVDADNDEAPTATSVLVAGAKWRSVLAAPGLALVAIDV